MTAVKICGLNDAAGFDAAVEAGADYLGLNFFPASPRYLTPGAAAGLSARHAGGPPRVGLFVNPADADIEAALAAIKLDILQLYVPPARAAGLRARFGLPVWRAVGVATAADFPRSAEGADVLLIEPKPPAGATRPGGNAVSFDHTLIAGWNPPCPWVLAGGLTLENVTQAIRATRARIVDLSSGVERSRGVKDPAKIRAFVAACKATGL